MDAIEQIRQLLRERKEAAITAEQMGGGGGGDPAAAGMDPAMAAAGGGGMDPAAAGMDPAMAAAGGGGMDPSMMGMPPAEPQDLETLASQGDPLSQHLLDMDEKLDTVVSVLGMIADKANIQVPVSKMLSQMSGNKKSESPEAQPTPTVDPISETVEDTAVTRESSPLTPGMGFRAATGTTRVPTEDNPVELTGNDERRPRDVMPLVLQGRASSPGEGGGAKIAARVSPKPVGAAQTIMSVLRK